MNRSKRSALRAGSRTSNAPWTIPQIPPEQFAMFFFESSSLGGGFQNFTSNTQRLEDSKEHQEKYTTGTVKLWESPGKAGGLPKSKLFWC